MLGTYEKYPSKKQFPMDDLIEYIVEMSTKQTVFIKRKSKLTFFRQLPEHQKLELNSSLAA